MKVHIRELGSDTRRFFLSSLTRYYFNFLFGLKMGLRCFLLPTCSSSPVFFHLGCIHLGLALCRREAAAPEAALTLGTGICALGDQLPSLHTLDSMAVSPEGPFPVEMAI